jgi:streptomycin 6-kinase
VLETPEGLKRNVIGAWGDRGADWLARLPMLVDEVLDRWSLRVAAPLSMTFQWVAAVRRDDGTPAVLKLGLPRADHQTVDAAALQAWAGHGAVSLLAHDPERGALLLQRAEPGRRLRELTPHRDDQATAVLAGVMTALHRGPVPSRGIPALTEVRSSFTAQLVAHTSGPLAQPLVQHALGLFEELTASSPTSVLLHGDLHHDNVLSDDRSEARWVAIDPHGWIGDPGFEVGPMLYNPDPGDRSDELLRLVPARIDQLADEVGIERERVVAWGFVAAVLSEVWSAEDTLDYAPTRALDVALLLEPRFR